MLYYMLIVTVQMKMLSGWNGDSNPGRNKIQHCVLASLPVPLYPLQYTGINTSFLTNLKQTLVGKQTWILLTYVDCIKYC